MNFLEQLGQTIRNRIGIGPSALSPTYPRFTREGGREYAQYGDGTIYLVRADGWKRVTLRRHDKKRLDKKNNL